MSEKVDAKKLDKIKQMLLASMSLSSIARLNSISISTLRVAINKLKNKPKSQEKKSIKKLYAFRYKLNDKIEFFESEKGTDRRERASEYDMAYLLKDKL